MGRVKDLAIDIENGEPKLYVFRWYDSSSDCGHNEDVVISDDPEGYIKNNIDPHGELDVSYSVFSQEGYKVSIVQA